MKKDTKERNPLERAESREETGSGVIDPCGLCTSLFSRDEKAARGRSGWRFMTEREFKVLKVMKSLRETAWKIKQRIRGIEQDLQDRPAMKPQHAPEGTDEEVFREERLWEQQMAEELLDHCARLANLKDQWKEMDRERMAAQEERMRMLGHIQ